MGSRFQQVLRSLCFKTGWKYAVFWKLKHRTRTMLTWEDAYYDGNQYLDKKCFNATTGSLIEGSYPHDLLGLAVAKMSYQVFSLGEGVVGQVAVSGKHSWTFLDQHVADYSSSPEYCDGWQTQFSSGVKTIAVVAVIPHGVVQLGSLHKVAEDMKLVDHIRRVFSELQDSAGFIPSSMNCNTESSCVSDTCTRISDSVGHDCAAKQELSFHENEVNLWSQLFLPLGEYANCLQIFPSVGDFPNSTLKIKMHEGTQSSMPGNDISLPSSSENTSTRLQTSDMEYLNNTIYVGEKNDIRDLGKKPEISSMPSVKNVKKDKTTPSNTTVQVLDPPALQGQGYIDNILQLPSLNLHQEFELPIKSISPFNFGAGYELYEALGPSFVNDCVWGAETPSSDSPVEISEGMGSCSLLMENPDMHLLDVVVAKVSQRKDERESEKKSCHDTNESLLTAEITPSTSVGTLNSAGYSSSLNSSVICGVESFRGFSSNSSSRGMPVNNKMHKKRVRNGESCRPRPRDRQLIQDRIKELRELVPDGSKCSIDSLLERTIRHMTFLQSVTKHADKLNKCSASKLLDKDTGMRRFSCPEQGSSWAVEVGNDQKVCPIIVENINMNGQMIVEMLCKERGQFLEIAEVIRSLGLSILKGISEAYGNKTWVCFVVENNRDMHRMDILCSLMQLLQPKMSI